MIAKTFSQIIKFNPFHDRIGRFTGPGGYASFSANPDTKAGAAAIKREQKNNPLIGAAFGTMKSPKQKIADGKVPSSRKQAKEILSAYGCASKESVDMIKDIYYRCDTKGGLKMEDGKIRVKKCVHEKALETSKEILKKTEFKDTSTEAEYNSLRSFIRSNPVSISNQDKSSIADYGNYLKENFGGVKVSNKGMSLDSFYGELSSSFPQYFNQSKQSNPADQLQHINNVLSKLKPKTYKLSADQIDSYSKEMTKEIINGYFKRAS